MDYIFSAILRLTPHWFGEWVLEHYVRVIQKRIKSSLLQFLVVLITIFLFLAVAIAIVIGLIFLISFILLDVLKLY